MPISQKTRSLAAGFFVGATIFWMGAFLLHKIGYLYVHTGDYSREFREFNVSMTTVKQDIPAFEKFLQGARTAFEEARANGRLPHPSGASGTAEVIPEFYADNADILAKRNATPLIIWKDDDYKILIQSEACTAIALLRPDLVDPVKQRYPTFCRFFGVWSENGKML